MILLDCGNSQVKAQRYVQGRLRASFACAYEADGEKRLSRWLEADADNRAFLCSVLDPVRQAAMDECLQARFASAVTRLRSEAQALGVVNGYREPHKLGADRWMALLGAAEICSGDCLVIDAGSAITLDLLRADGRHLGGAILPGFNTSIERFRRIFSHIDFDHPDIAGARAPGCSTEAAIRIDYASSIEGLPALVKAWSSLLENDFTLLLVGGDAARVQALLDAPARIRTDLVFRGMRRLACQ